MCPTNQKSINQQPVLSEKEAAIEKDKEEKRQLVLSTITSYCKEDSEFDGLKRLAAGLNTEGGKLECKVLSGGKTNYSYKVFLNEDPDTAVFAKLSFDFALWNPDHTVLHDLIRTDNEFQLTKKFSKMMGENAPVAQPYHLINLDKHTKLTITQWAPGDEQWSNQFIDGVVDKRLLPKLANALATLNLAPLEDPMYNDNIRPICLSLTPALKDVFNTQVINGSGVNGSDPGVEYARQVGMEEFTKIMDAYEDEFKNQRDCLVHFDAHPFNLLVEKKPDIDQPELFGENGHLYICDWEMSIAGPQGSEPGKFVGFPIACALCHATGGRKKEAYHILDCIEEFWDSYEANITERGGKDAASMAIIYRQYLGWSAFITHLVIYLLDIFSDVLPTDDLSVEAKAEARGAYATMGLRLLQISWGSDRKDLKLDEYKDLFHDLMTKEIERLLDIAATTKRIHPRRNSALRQSGRRVSDGMVIEEVARRLSSLVVEGESDVMEC